MIFSLGVRTGTSVSAEMPYPKTRDTWGQPEDEGFRAAGTSVSEDLTRFSFAAAPRS